MRKNPSLEDGYIAELESHLRDLIDQCGEEGMDPREAFEKAVQDLGPPC